MDAPETDPALHGHIQFLQVIIQRVAAAAGDIARVQELWADCRARFGQGGDFLFGRFTLADAMFAPVVTRLRTYSVSLESDSETYCTCVLNHPAMKEWIDAAEHEPWLIDKYEFK